MIWRMPATTSRTCRPRRRLLLLAVCLAACGESGPSSYDDPYFAYSAARPLLPGQWNLQNQAPAVMDFPASTAQNGKALAAVTIHNAGLDARIVDVWARGYTGQGIVIGVLDDGVELDHPDLAVRRDLSVDIDSKGLVAGGTGAHLTDTDGHGTCVAGVAAAIGGNGIGIRGLAPGAQVASINAKHNTGIDDWYVHPVGYYWQAGLEYQDQMGSGELAKLTALTSAPVIQVKNSSTKTILFDAPETYGEVYSAIARTAASGVITTLAAGNMRRTRQQEANTNFENASPYVLNVAAVGSNGQVARYSNFGASVFVATLSESSYWNLAGVKGDTVYADGLGVYATDRRTRRGNNYDGNTSSVFLPDLDDLDYTAQFDGTSAAAPTLAGMMAVLKQANPGADVRMAKHLLARTCRVVDEGDQSAASTWTVGGVKHTGWQTNAAGLRFNPSYGFGLPDVTALALLARRTAYVTAETFHTTGALEVASERQTIAAGDAAGQTVSVDVSVPAAAKQALESVEVLLEVTGGDRDEWEIVLSKGKTSSRLWAPSSELPNPANPLLGDPHPEQGLKRLVLTHAFFGEDPDGTWTLTVSNPAGKAAASFKRWGLVLHLGALVLEQPGTTITLERDLTVSGLGLRQPGSVLVVPAGRTLRVASDLHLSGGALQVHGTLGRASTIRVSRYDLALTQVTEELAYQRGARAEVTGGTLGGSGTIDLPAGSDGRGGVFRAP